MLYPLSYLSEIYTANIDKYRDTVIALEGFPRIHVLCGFLVIMSKFFEHYISSNIPNIIHV